MNTEADNSSQQENAQQSQIENDSSKKSFLWRPGS